MKVYKIDHCEVFSKGRTDLDSIENILKQTNHELGDIEKINKELLQINISDFWHFLSLPTSATFGIKKIYDYCKFMFDKNNTYKNFFDKVNEIVTNVHCITLEEAELNYPNTKNLAVGYYTLHPVDKKSLVVLNNYHQDLYKDKDDEIVYLLSRMGAKRIRISTSDSILKKHNHQTKVNFSKDSIIDLGAELGSSHKLGTDSKTERVLEYEGNITDIDLHLLNNSVWFKNDGQMTSIFKSRIAKDNKLKSYCYQSVYNNQFCFDFGVAAKFLAPDEDPNKTKLEANLRLEFDNLKNKVRYFEVEFH